MGFGFSVNEKTTPVARDGSIELMVQLKR